MSELEHSRVTDSSMGSSHCDLFKCVEEIGRCEAGPAAFDVDLKARFPHEAIDALRRAKLLSASIPESLGGFGCSIEELAIMCEVLGQHCASTAMIFAMHHIQVASAVRHAGTSAYLKRYLSDLVEHQYLIGSVTSEVGVGGDLRASIAAVEASGGRFALNKDATTISYGNEADDLLVTARRSTDAAPNDQVIVLIHKADYSLEQTSKWDTMGMRGTCSPGFKLRAHGTVDQVFKVPFALVATQTLLPYAHILWCSCWLGIAKGAVANARSFVRAEARKNPGTVPPTALRLAEVSNLLQSMQQNIHAVRSDYEKKIATPNGLEYLSTMGFALCMNNLKITCSQLAVQIVSASLGICGISGYKNDSPYSLGRHLRDAHSAALMIGNDRILATNASLLLVYKDD